MVRKNIIIQDGSNVYFTSDTHFQHGNIIKFCNRPYSNVEEMNNAIIENWNSVVGPNDIVFHLGDFAWSGSWHKWLDTLKECNESEYWLELLFETNSLTEMDFKDFHNKCVLI